MHTPRPAWIKVGQCRAEALFKKQQQLHDGKQAKAEYQTELPAMQQRTPAIVALRLAHDARQKTIR
jgi:hypothetical protein